MNVELKDRGQAWRGRGRPRTPVSEAVAQLARATYKTGQVGVIDLGQESLAEARELLSSLRAYAANCTPPKQLRVQGGPDEGQYRFEMVDKTTTKGSGK